MNTANFVTAAKEFLGMRRPPLIRQPVFIVGCGRSGTTLLFDLLSQHPLLVRTTGYEPNSIGDD